MSHQQHVITIDPDGWVWLRMNDGKEMGLGDLNVDVVIQNNRAGRKVFTPEELRQMRKLIERGDTYANVAGFYGISRPTLYKLIGKRK